MTVDTDRIIFRFQQEFLFSGLEPAQIARLISEATQVVLERDTVVYSQGAPGDCFYLILQGKVRLTRWRNNREEFLGTLSSGGYFGEQAFWPDRTRPVTVTSLGKVTLLRLDQKQILNIAGVASTIQANLKMISESRSLANEKLFSYLGEDESVQFITRKHDFILYANLILPLLLFLAAFPVIAFAIISWSNLVMAEVVLSFGLILLGISILWGAWNWVDWENDYYIVTNKRVILEEKVLGLYDTRREAPLDTVLTVNVNSSQMGRILNYGDVNVRTFTGGIYFKRVKRAYLFAAFVEYCRSRARTNIAEEKSSLIDDAILQGLEKEKNPGASRTEAVKPQGIQAFLRTPEDMKSKAPQKQQKPRQGFGEWLENILKVRFEEKGTITYRKHWFLLLQKSWFFLLLLLGYLGAIGYLSYLYFFKAQPYLMINWACGLEVLILLIISGGLLYNLLDWSNDIYRLTQDQIHDIEKKPLGQEIKKTANLDSILSIEHERENILGIIFNFGTVTVSVGETQFKFLGVHNPDQVHQDVTYYREAFNKRRQDDKERLERNHQIDYLMAYHRLVRDEADENNSKKTDLTVK